MKSKLLLILVITTVLFQQKISAQSALPLPEVSTPENPAWYFIQVVGEGASRENRVFTAENGYLYGKELNETNNAQLFRFEKTGNSYFIISKSTGKKIDVAMNGGEEALSLSDNGIGFTFDTLATDYYNITASKTPTGGDTSKKWAHQANNNSSYKIILVSTTWSSGYNSQFSFIPYEDMNLEYSTSTEEVWYSIENTGANSGCITDVASAGIDIKMEIENYTAENNNQLWKLVKKGTKTNFINKATGNAILTQSDVSENNSMYNYTQLAEDDSNNKGWTLTHLRAGQYSISGQEEDNITRYLTASLEGNDPDEFDDSNLISSNFAWKLNKRSSSSLSIPSVQQADDFYVYSENRKIVVTGVDDYIVRTMQGVTVNNNSELSVGIYLVTANGKTKKVLVK